MDILIPTVPALAKGFRVEQLSSGTVAFRSADRLHIWPGKIFRDIGLLLDSTQSARQILAGLQTEHDAAEAIRALHQLSHHSLLVQRIEHAALPATTQPVTFGPADAPYRTCIQFVLAAGASGEGYYVYGKGWDEAAARTGCVAESVERHSLHCTSNDQRVRLSADEIRECAVPTAALLPPGEARDLDEATEWTPAYSPASRSTRYLPATYCYFNVPGRRVGQISPDSTGCAAGETLEAAALGGFFEIIERDSLRQWWLGKNVGRLVRTEGFTSGPIAETGRYLKTLGRNLVLIDITSGAGVPAFVALSFTATGRGLLGSAAHFDAPAAMQSAVLELGLALNWSEMVRVGPLALSPEMRYGPGAYVETRHPRAADGYRSDKNAYGPNGLDAAVELMRGTGRELLLLDTTRPGAQYATVRVTVPGLFRFNPGKMYRMAESGCGK
jgi:thiazole/oxazole-forming peptide maturase SagD family component